MEEPEKKIESTDAQKAEMPEVKPARADEELIQMLQREPVLSMQLYETLKSGRWLVTMHRKIKDRAGDDLLSESTHHDFPLEEVVTVMQAQCRAVLVDHRRKLDAMERRVADQQRWR